MMSDSDDTDVLLLIPPDLFVVPSSESEDESHLRAGTNIRQTSVVSEILEHVQSLENRICAIESRETSLEASLLNVSLDSQGPSFLNEYSPARQSHPLFNVARFSSLQNTPGKPLCCSSSKSSPGCLPLVTNTPRTKEKLRDLQCLDVTNETNAFSETNQGDLITFDDSTMQTRRASESPRVFLKFDRHRQSASSEWKRRNESSEFLGRSYDSTLRRDSRRDVIGDMELSEVDELLQEMEATEIELAKRIDNSNARRSIEERDRVKNWNDTGNGRLSSDTKFTGKSPIRRLDFQFTDEDFQKPCTSLNFQQVKDTHRDIFLQEKENKNTKMNFKTWQSTDVLAKQKSNLNENLEKENNFLLETESTNKNFDKSIESSINPTNPFKVPEQRTFRSSETFHGGVLISNAKSSMSSRSLPNIKNSSSHVLMDSEKSQGVTFYDEDRTDTGATLQDSNPAQCTTELQQTIREIRSKGKQETNDSSKCSENCQRKTSRLRALSDFWDCDGTKSQEEMLRIKLEEEKFRREHCEHLIQELQKRLLEQQEKVAVAIRVDNEKNAAISQFQEAWSKLRQKWETLEKEHCELESELKTANEKHHSEINEYQQQIKRGEGELSKALDLAAGYKEKSDSLVKEKIELLKSHADELENYKSLVQDAERRYENLKDDYSKLLERNKQIEETSNNIQQELNKERLRNSEVRTEMGVIHKALDACEAELTILRQEKDNLQLKIKEEVTRNGILEQNKNTLLEAVDAAKSEEKAAKEEAQMLLARQEQIRSELRDIYQNQLDEVVKTKLKEFQEQLDASEAALQAVSETRQRAIAECAARKIKSIIDKHQLEINLLEEKHNEEKRLAEIQLAQAAQRAVMLEVQLKSQRAGKTQLAEQLHSVMQKQWQQALQIISGGQIENLSPLQRLNAERIFDPKNSKRCNSACCNKNHRSTRLELRSSSSQNLQNVNLRQEEDESLVTLTSNDETPLSRKESKDDLRKYIKMILDMQQPSRDEFVHTKITNESNPSPPPVTREVPRKHYTKKEPNGLSEESVTWQRADEQSIHDTSEYMQIPQGPKSEQQKSKPPWK